MGSHGEEGHMGTQGTRRCRGAKVGPTQLAQALFLGTVEDNDDEDEEKDCDCFSPLRSWCAT